MRGVFLVRKWKVLLSMDSPNGKIPYRKAGPGYILGLPGTLGNLPYSLTAESLEDSEVAFVKRKDVVDLLRRRTDLCYQVVEILSWEVRDLRRAWAQCCPSD